MAKIFSLVRFFVFLGTLLCNHLVLPMHHDNCITQKQNFIQHIQKFVKSHPQLVDACTACVAGLSGFLQFMHIFVYLDNKCPENPSDILLPYLCISIIPSILVCYCSKIKLIDYWHCYLRYYMAGMALQYTYFQGCIDVNQQNLNNQFAMLYERFCQGSIGVDEFFHYFKAIFGMTSTVSDI